MITPEYIGEKDTLTYRILLLWLQKKKNSFMLYFFNKEVMLLPIKEMRLEKGSLQCDHHYVALMSKNIRSSGV